MNKPSVRRSQSYKATANNGCMATITFHGRPPRFKWQQLAVSGVGGQFSSGGDSGSLVVDAVTRHPVGLLFAGGGLGTTFVNPIGPVLDRFGVEIV